MVKMEIEFDFKEEQSRLFGSILRPVAKVSFIYKGKELMESVYVDSGADVSLMPKSVGDWLGLKIEETDEVTEIKGVGERGIPIIIKKVKIKIGEKLLESRVAWSLVEEVPLLLGRLDVFKLFTICFQKNLKTTFSE